VQTNVEKNKLEISVAHGKISKIDYRMAYRIGTVLPQIVSSLE
jgi:hypothetical protein